MPRWKCACASPPAGSLVAPGCAALAPSAVAGGLLSADGAFESAPRLKAEQPESADAKTRVAESAKTSALMFVLVPWRASGKTYLRQIYRGVKLILPRPRAFFKRSGLVVALGDYPAGKSVSVEIRGQCEYGAHGSGQG